MTSLPTLQFSANTAIAKLLDQVVVLLLGTPPTVVGVRAVVGSPLDAAAAFQNRMTITGGHYGHA